MSIKYLHGNCLNVLKEMEEKSIYTCVTSPPYWGLRDYGSNPEVWGGDENCNHEWLDHFTPPKGGKNHPERPSTVGNNKYMSTLDLRGVGKTSQFCTKCGAWAGELGLEPKMDMYVDNLVSIFREVRRVLKDDGTVWLNIGDTYAGGGRGFEWDGWEDSKQSTNVGSMVKSPTIPEGLKRKDLCMIPARVAIALQADGWYLRSDIVWHKPNAMPESTRDRPTKSHEYIYLLSKNDKYYYDVDAIREPYTESMNRWGGDKLVAKGHSTWDEGTGQNGYRDRKLRPNPLGKNKRSVWSVNTVSSSEAHFATFPKKLISPCIEAGCPKEICKECGKPRLKVKKKVGEFQRRWSKNNADESPYNKQGSMQNLYELEYDDCDCNAGYEPGWVLDPFGGSGTTASVCQELMRNCILIDVNKKYIDIQVEKTRQPYLWEQDNDN